MRVYLLTSEMHHVNFHLKEIYYCYLESRQCIVISDLHTVKLNPPTQKLSYLFCPEVFTKVLQNYRSCLDIFGHLNLDLRGPEHMYVHIVSLPTDLYVLGFAEWIFPQNILCLINSLEHPHFQQCFMKTLH